MAAKISKASAKRSKTAKATRGASKAAKGPKADPKAPKPQSGPEAAYRVGGGYWASVVGLRSLGVGKMHPFAKIVPAVRKAMEGAGTWRAFTAKTGKLSADERMLMNVMVTSRADYGKPLVALGYEVRWDGRAEEAGLFKVGSR
jgi:hypothetical protein